METTFRIICVLCIIFLRFPLYYLAPVKTGSYTDVMNNDTSLCNNPIKEFFSKSEYTKECATLNYPRDIDTLTFQHSTVEKFLCLGVYDATYKVCQYTINKTWTSTFTKREDLDLSIQNITGFKPNGEDISSDLKLNEKNFCNLLSGYKPTYKTVKPVLLKLAELLKDPFQCNKICIDFDHKLNPLCAILAWINWLDQTIINNTIANSNSELGNKLNVSSSNSSIPQPTKAQTKSPTTDTDPLKQHVYTADTIPEENMANDGPGKQTIKSTTSKNSSSQPQVAPVLSATNNAEREELVVDISGKGAKSGKDNVKNILIQSTTLKTSVVKPVMSHDVSQLTPEDNSQQLDSANTDMHQLPKTVDSNSHIVEDNKKSNVRNNASDKTKSSQVEEVKSTTLSENTQDNAIESNAANNPSPDEFSPDEDQLSNNLNDGLSQPIDSVDGQNDNIPDTSGQREIENIRAMKNEEESHFFTYFAITSLGFIAGYIAYHNKQKILAIVLEGRRSKNNRNRRRPSTANYRKLDCTLEEAVTSQCNANVTHVIY